MKFLLIRCHTLFVHVGLHVGLDFSPSGCRKMYHNRLITMHFYHYYGMKISSLFSCKNIFNCKENEQEEIEHQVHILHFSRDFVWCCMYYAILVTVINHEHTGTDTHNIYTRCGECECKQDVDCKICQYCKDKVKK